MMIYLVRHAWAGRHGDPRYPDDSLRPLTEKGAKRMRRVVKKLVRRGFAPQAVATSPFVRAKQTADILVERCNGQPSLSILDDLTPDSHIEPLLEWTRSHHPHNVAWVGHAPDLNRLAAELIGAGAGQINLEKGAVAAIRLADPVAAGNVAAGAGELVWIATARLLRC